MGNNIFWSIIKPYFSDKDNFSNKTKSRWQLKRLRAEPAPVSYHPGKFSGHKSCESEDKSFSNCYEI